MVAVKVIFIDEFFFWWRKLTFFRTQFIQETRCASRKVHKI